MVSARPVKEYEKEAKPAKNKKQQGQSECLRGGKEKWQTCWCH